ncbi:MAG: helix-turn-helix transcriptional regulator [Euryarchaeota archaeon]|nr:helix-turn-helix transcriptional regulator [Euryarchaeota archaeon]
MSKIFKLLAQKGVVEILEKLEGKAMKYKEIEEIVGNPSTTSRRLSSLGELGAVRRKVSSEKYRPVYYALTKEGRELLSIVREISEKYRA